MLQAISLLKANRPKKPTNNPTENAEKKRVSLH